jgi:hypothetical protein
MVTYTSGELTAIFIQVIIALVIVRRSYAISRGVPFSAARVAILPVLIVVLWGASELASILLTPWAVPYLLALDVVLLLAAAVGFARVAERRTVVWRNQSGGWDYRLPFAVTLLYVALFLLRIVVAAVFFPSSLVLGAPTGGYLPTSQQLLLAIVDALFSVSAGLLLGRSWGSYRKVAEFRSSAGPSPPMVVSR